MGIRYPAAGIDAILFDAGADDDIILFTTNLPDTIAVHGYGGPGNDQITGAPGEASCAMTTRAETAAVSTKDQMLLSSQSSILRLNSNYHSTSNKQKHCPEYRQSGSKLKRRSNLQRLNN